MHWFEQYTIFIPFNLHSFNHISIFSFSDFMKIFATWFLKLIVEKKISEKLRLGPYEEEFQNSQVAYRIKSIYDSVANLHFFKWSFAGHSLGWSFMLKSTCAHCTLALLMHIAEGANFITKISSTSYVWMQNKFLSLNITLRWEIITPFEWENRAPQ